MTRLHKLRALVPAPIAVLLIVLATSLAEAEPPEWVQPAIDIAKSPDKDAQARVDAAKSLTEGWKDSLPVLIQNIDAYYRTDVGPPYTEDDVASLVPLTDVVVRIVVAKDGAIQAFRKSDSDKTIKLLAWAARAPQHNERDRNLRFNASYILANVVDNSSICIILDHLRDPELGPTGMINLLQVATGVASYAYKENVEATRATVDILRPRVENAGSGKIAILVESLSRRAQDSQNANVALPPDSSYCRDYDYAATPP